MELHFMGLSQDAFGLQCNFEFEAVCVHRHKYFLHAPQPEVGQNTTVFLHHVDAAGHNKYFKQQNTEKVDEMY